MAENKAGSILSKITLFEKLSNNEISEAADDGEGRSGRQQSLAHLHAAEQEDRHDGRHQERRTFV